MATIYLYRLTYFGGTAPCNQDDVISLAICKRDMRRVIGRRIKEKGERDIWIAGVLGIGLSKKGTFQGTGLEIGDLIYIARVDDVVEFHDYFTKTNKRNDCIYKPCKDGKFQSGGEFFEHGGSNCHKEDSLQDRDWDVKHKNHRKYVLKSNTYHFFSKKESDVFLKESGLGEITPKGVGHRYCEFNADKALNLCCDKGEEKLLEIPKINHSCEKRGTNL